ncbi:MAG: DUF1573 domain-containing protein [Bacteroidia bacterium]
MKATYFTLVFSLVFLAFACDQKQKETSNSTETPEAIDPKIIEESNPHTADGDASIQELAEVKFDHTRHNFGKVYYKQKVLYNFKFENTGEKDLIILDARASCGCTTPEWPKEPIKPGETGTITVGFKSTSKGPFNKSITVDANTSPKSTVLHISGEVLEDN